MTNGTLSGSGANHYDQPTGRVECQPAYCLSPDWTSAVGLNVIGTLGLLLAAKRRGGLTACRPHLDHLVEQGFRISPRLYAQVLEAAGESLG